LDEKKHSEEREELIEKMIKNFPVLRVALHNKQRELADKVGIIRRTMMVFKNRKRPLLWSLYFALAFVL